MGDQGQRINRPRRWEHPTLVLADYEFDNRREAFQIRKLLAAGVFARKKGGKISTSSGDVVPFQYPHTSSLAHRVNEGVGCVQALLYGRGERADAPGRHKPAADIVRYELWYARHLGCDDRPAERQRFHQDDRQALGKARQNDGPCIENQTTHL